MAFTVSNIPKAIEVAHPRSSRGYTPAMSRLYRVNASQTIKRGDLIIQSGGKASKGTTLADNAPAAGTVLGTAANDLTTTATVLESTVLVVYDGAENVFVANAVGGVATDFTMSDYTKLMQARNLATTTDPVGKEVYAIDVVAAAVGSLATVMDLVRKAGQAPADSLLNPRVYFIFKASSLFMNL